jgi:hypothetical protein
MLRLTGKKGGKRYEALCVVLQIMESRKYGLPVTRGFVENIGPRTAQCTCKSVIAGTTIVHVWQVYLCFTQMPFSMAYDSSVHFLTGVGESGPPSLLSTGVPRNLWSLENQAFPDTLQQDFAHYLYHVIQRTCWGEKWYGESASWWQVGGERGTWGPQTAPLAGWQQWNCFAWFLCRYVYGTLVHITFPLNVSLLSL